MFGHGANAVGRTGQHSPRPRLGPGSRLLVVSLVLPKDLLSELREPRRPADVAPVGKLLPRQLVERRAAPLFERPLSAERPRGALSSAV
jgi:hypothetical protein